MTKEKTKQFNFRIPQHLYNEVKAKADENKITMTDYIIGKLKQEDEEPSEQLDSKYKKLYIAELNKQIEKQEETIRKQEKAIKEKDEHIEKMSNKLSELSKKAHQLTDQQQQLALAAEQKEQKTIELKETTKNRRKWWQFFGGDNE